MQKALFLLILSICIHYNLVSCGTHGVHTQTEVNNLKCTAITNSVTIEPNSISSDDPVTNLDTLITIFSIGTNLIIRNNPLLTDISGLRNLAFVGNDLIIENNPNLNICCGLDFLIHNGVVQGRIIIQNNGGGDCMDNGVNVQPCLLVPTLSGWATIILGLALLVFGTIVIKLTHNHFAQLH